MFLEVRNNATYESKECPEVICRELVRIDRIIHVYMVATDNKAICIEYTDRWNENRKMYETFEYEWECHKRFDSISKKLGGKTK
jgi:hypothetical protein